MFFREKKSPTAKQPTLQLVENQRIDGKIRQKVLISLGTHFNLPAELRSETARTIENKLLGQDVLWNNNECDQWAERIIKKIQSDGKWVSLREQITKGLPVKEDLYTTAEVFIDQVEHTNDRELGPLLIGCKMWDILGFSSVLTTAGFNCKQIQLAQISILNRLISGDSEHSIPGWIKTTAVEDLIDEKAEEYSFHRFYSISDRLLSKKDIIEPLLYENAKKYFDHDSSIYLYDLTNTYFEGSQENNPKAEHNKNQKENRSDCPQVVIALILDHEGFIRKHFVFNGKLTDVKSLEKILKSFENEINPTSQPTIIMDRGIACKENIDFLKSKGMKYMVASRREEEIKLAEQFDTADFKIIKDDKSNKVEVCIYNDAEKDEIKLLCKSTGRENKETAMRNNREIKLEDDLKKLQRTVTEGNRINPKDVERSIGRLKERHSSVGKYYQINFTPFRFSFHILDKINVSKILINSLIFRKEKADSFQWSHKKITTEIEKLQRKYPDDFQRINISITPPSLVWEIEDEKKDILQKTDGNYIIQTNRKDLKDEDIWKMYMMLTRVEKAFRNFKSDLGLRPNYHYIERRVDAHIFITILAYHLLHAVEYILRSRGCRLSWKTVKRITESHSFSTIILPTTNGAVIHLRKPGKPESVHLEIYDKLNINCKDIKAKKIIA